MLHYFWMTNTLHRCASPWGLNSPGLDVCTLPASSIDNSGQTKSLHHAFAAFSPSVCIFFSYPPQGWGHCLQRAFWQEYLFFQDQQTKCKCHDWHLALETAPVYKHRITWLPPCSSDRSMSEWPLVDAPCLCFCHSAQITHQRSALTKLASCLSYALSLTYYHCS